MKFITNDQDINNDRSDVHAKGQGQRSKVKVTCQNPTFQFEFKYDDAMIHNAW